jgi:Na+-translocating ferredoxin:NAD+ oxidoreductase subunit C
VNAVESEPYLRAEECLLRDKGAEVMEGIAILKKVLEPKKTFITTSQATTIVLPPSKDERVDVELVSFEARYPQDMPGQLLEALDGSRKRPMADAIIIKPSTAFAVYEAIVIAKPMVERYVSVSGGAIKRPAVLKTRIGTTIGDLIEECGGFLDPPARLVIGSTLRGHSVYNLDVPITKTTSAVIALNAEEIGSQLRSPCIRCGRCIEVCPERLDPSLLFRLIERGMQSRAAELGLGACTVCGACGYICPSRMPLVAAFSSEPQITTKLAWTQLRGENPH